MRADLKTAGSALVACGLLLMVLAALLTGYNLMEARRAGEQAGESLEQLREQLPEPSDDGEDASEREIPNYLLDPDREMPEMEIDGKDYIGILEIQALGLSLPVMSEWSYPNLRAAPCRYSGSAYDGHFVIAAHNYSTHFGHLEALAAGAEVRFTDVENNVFAYKVVCTEILGPDSVEEMVSGQWDLTLFTCTYGGQARIAVRCIRADAL